LSPVGGSPLGMPAAAASKSVEHDLDPAGNAELVKNSKQVILDRVLSELEALSNFPIGESLGYATNYIDFARGKRRVGAVAEIRKRRLRERLEQKVQLAAARPHLARVYALNALSKQAEWLGATKNAVCTGAKRFDYGPTFGNVNHNHKARAWHLCTNVANQIECSPPIFTQLGTDHGDMGLFAFHQGKDDGLGGWRLNHLELCISGQGFHQKLSAHGGTVGG